MQVVRYHLENVRAFLGNHWALRLLVTPVLALATIVAAFGIATGGSLTEVLTVVGAYAAFSLGAVLVGLALERVGSRLTGESLLGP